jgi:hypothetical protein
MGTMMGAAVRSMMGFMMHFSFLFFTLFFNFDRIFFSVTVFDFYLNLLEIMIFNKDLDFFSSLFVFVRHDLSPLCRSIAVDSIPFPIRANSTACSRDNTPEAIWHHTEALPQVTLPLARVFVKKASASRMSSAQNEHKLKQKPNFHEVKPC